MLAHLGCLVEAVGRGEDALVLLRQHHYDLILLDIGLPGMSGIEVISEFYQHKMQPKTKAIAVTTLNDAETLQKCYAVGIKQVLHKPLEMDELVRVIHEVKAELSIV
jgi:CheY-like chemotaxis protein